MFVAPLRETQAELSLILTVRPPLAVLRKSFVLIVSALSAAVIAGPGGVSAATQTDSGFPRWSQFPATPKNVPKPTEYAKRVRAQEKISADRHRVIRSLKWDGEDPDTLAQKVRSRVDRELSKSVDPVATEAEINRFAGDLRRRINPPAQIDRFEDVPAARPAP